MEEFKDFISIIFRSTWTGIGLFMDLLGAVIYLRPELTEKLSFSNLIHQYLWLWIAIGSIILVFTIAYEAVKKIREFRESSKNSSSKNQYKFSHSGSGDNVAGNKIVYGDDKKKEPKIFDSDGLDFKFYRRWRHRELLIENGTLEQVLNSIKNGIATLFLYYQESHETSYETDSSRTKFYDSEIDNVIYHGVVFRGIKKFFEKGQDGNFLKKNEEKIDLLFTLYVEPINKKKNRTEFYVVLDGDGLYAEYFFEEVQKYLGSRFIIAIKE